MRNRSDARDRAVAILSGAKVRALEAEGLMVVDAAYHDRLKRTLQEIAEVMADVQQGTKEVGGAIERIEVILFEAEALLTPQY